MPRDHGRGPAGCGHTSHGSALLVWMLVLVGGIMIVDGSYGLITGRG